MKKCKSHWLPLIVWKIEIIITYLNYVPNLNLVLGCSDSIVVVILLWMYGLTALNVENYPPIDEQIEKFDVLLPSKAYPVIAPIFNTFYVNGIYLMILFTIERYYAICQQRKLSLKKNKVCMVCIFVMSALYSMPMFWETMWKIVPFKSGNFSIPYKTDLVSDYSTVYYRWYKSFGGMLTYFVIPVICFLFINILIIAKVGSFSISLKMF